MKKKFIIILLLVLSITSLFSVTLTVWSSEKQQDCKYCKYYIIYGHRGFTGFFSHYLSPLKELYRYGIITAATITNIIIAIAEAMAYLLDLNICSNI
jgi:hypothetical protein